MSKANNTHQRKYPCTHDIMTYMNVQENFSKTSRIQIFDLYPVVGYLFVRCFLIFFGGRFGRVSCGTLPILATIYAVLVELHRVLLRYKTFLLFFDWDFFRYKSRLTAFNGDRALHTCCSPVSPTNGRGSYTLHPRSTPPVDIPPRSFLPMLQLHFLASDDRVCCSIGASLARKWSCSNGKNDRGGIPTGGVLLGCNV